MASATFLLAARQSRLTARACVSPADAIQHKAAARFWIAQARADRPTAILGITQVARAIEANPRPG